MRRQSSTDRLGRLAMLIVVTLVLILPISTVSRAGTFTFPVQSEQAITGTTTGLGGAQTDDGVLETLRESDTDPDPVTAPATQSLTTGTMIAGTFPGDLSSEDGVFVQYRETTDAVEASTGYRSNTGTNTVSSPKTRTWSGAAWNAETEQSTAGSPIRALRMAWTPTASTTRIFVTQSDDGWLDAYACSPACTVTSDIGQVWLSGSPPGTPEKRFDVAYERASGDALLVYAVYTTVTTRDLAYRTYVGGSWSAEQYLDDTGHATDLQYRSVRLASRAGSDQIGLIAGENNNTHVNVWIWTGTSFGSNTEFTSVDGVTREQVAIGWESNSGNLVAVTVDGTNPERVAYREYTTSWSGIGTVQCATTGNNARWLALSADPVSTADDMVLAVGDNGNDLSTCYWNGGTFTNFQTQDTAIDSASARAFDFAWESSGSKGLLVYGTTAGQITYRTFTAPNTWGGATNAAMGANTHPWVRLATNPFPRTGAVKIIGAVMEAIANDLGAITWDGSTFTVVGASTFTADTGTTTYDSFDLAYHDTNDDQLLDRYDWTGVPAGVSYTLQVKGYREDEDINVQVLTPASTWNTRLTISATANTLYTYTLTPVEYNAGGPSIRFVDANGPGGTQSDLWIDWASITTVELRYALEVRQDVTGIITGSNPILTVRGNITSGGENFHMYVWNFTSASWNLLLAAPFTSTNAYHNASLAADHLSGGTVRVRFVDAASQDATRWALSLDFVAVVITNDQAALTNAGVSPASGYITTSFTFFVRYSDPENNAPAFVNLTLDGISYAMVENNSADTNYVDGKDYFLNRVIGIRGTFNYSFSARASAGDLTLAATPVRQLSVLNRAANISNPITSDAVHTGRSYVRDFNGTDPDGDTLAWSISTNASWLSIGSGNGTVWGAAPPDIRSFYANLSVSDGFGGLAWFNYTLSVGNLPPSITTVVANLVLARRAFFSYDMNASDPDLDPLIWSLRTNASFLVMGPSSGTLSGIVSSVPSSYWIEVTASDGLGGIDFRNFSLAVVNRPPAIFVSAPSTAEAGASYSGSFSGTDPDDDPISWSLTTNATWLLIDAATGQLYGTPSPGTYFANLSGRDPYGGVAFQNFTIAVQGQSTTPPPDSPPGLRSELWTFSLIFLLFGVLIAIVMPRRRPIIESAFLIDQAGRVRFEFAIPGTAYDEGRLQSTLRGVSWRGLGRVSDLPYTLHIKPDPSGDWIFASRTSDSDRVMKSAEKLISKMQGDVTSRKKPRLSERSS